MPLDFTGAANPGEVAMTSHFTVLARALRLCAAAVLAVVLAGCVIQSKSALIAPAEGVAALPLTAYLTSYKEAEGGVSRDDDEPVKLIFKNDHYSSTDESFHIRFVSLPRRDTYIAEITGDDPGYTYAVARFRGNVLVLNVLLSDEDPEASLASERAGAGAEALRDVTVSDGAIVVTERKALDYLIQMNLDGKLTMAPFVLYVSEFADSKAPAMLVPDGEFWRVPAP